MSATDVLLAALRRRRQKRPRLRLGKAVGFDGRQLRPGYRVGYQVSRGDWIPGSILHLEHSPGQAPVAWLLTSAPGIPAIQTVRASECIRIDAPGLLRARLRRQPREANSISQ